MLLFFHVTVSFTSPEDITGYLDFIYVMTFIVRVDLFYTHGSDLKDESLHFCFTDVRCHYMNILSDITHWLRYTRILVIK